MEKRRPVGVYVDPRVDREVEHLAVDTGLTKSELYELGARILVELARQGRLTGETEKAVKGIRAILEKIKAVN